MKTRRAPVVEPSGPSPFDTLTEADFEDPEEDKANVREEAHNTAMQCHWCVLRWEKQDIGSIRPLCGRGDLGF